MRFGRGISKMQSQFFITMYQNDCLFLLDKLSVMEA